MKYQIMFNNNVILHPGQDTVMTGTLAREVKTTRSGSIRGGVPIEGVFFREPEPGYSFYFESEPIDIRFDIRQITTSVVKSVETIPEGFRFTTVTGSIYRLDTHA